jgi:hypothetical protein
MTIDCDHCALIDTDACDDCVVTFILRAGETLEVDEAEATALDNLADAGLVPPLRLVPIERRAG